MDIMCACLTSLGFVGVVYAWPVEFNFMRHVVFNLERAALNDAIFVKRNAVETVYRRVLSFSVTVLYSAWYLYISGETDTFQSSSSQLYGSSLTKSFVSVSGVWIALRCFLSTCLLFAGPLVERYIDNEPLLQRGDPLVVDLRSYVISPFVEELFFRGVLFSILRRRSALSQVLLSAVLFSLAHSHHIFHSTAAVYREIATRSSAHGSELKRKCWLIGLHETGMVCAFSFLFGLISGYYYSFVTNRSILNITILHCQCNLFGPPEFAFLRKRDCGRMHRLSVATIYVAGILLFIVSVSCS